jgi:hypothetical protein
LLLEHLPLLHGIVQLGVCIADLSAVDEKLKALGEAWLAAMPLCQRGHDLRVITNEARIQQLGLEKLTHELVEQPRCCLQVNMAFTGAMCVTLSHCNVHKRLLQPDVNCREQHQETA